TFRFYLNNSTLSQAAPIRYPFFFLSHIIVTPALKYDMMDKTHNAHDIFVVAADLCGHGSHPKRREPPC
ncbi:MAG: hypothetical protein KH138_13710, partial [Firmicutes bacterium]|nr:hypothetical protein [Bacillota bacterium]